MPLGQLAVGGERRTGLLAKTGEAPQQLAVARLQGPDPTAVLQIEHVRSPHRVHGQQAALVNGSADAARLVVAQQRRSRPDALRFPQDGQSIYRQINAPIAPRAAGERRPAEHPGRLRFRSDLAEQGLDQRCQSLSLTHPLDHRSRTRLPGQLTGDIRLPPQSVNDGQPSGDRPAKLGPVRVLVQ